MREALASGVLQGGVAVVPPGDTTLGRPLENAGLRLVENPDAASGVASSLRAGLDALALLAPVPAGQPTAALVVLADQPLLSNATIVRLVESWRSSGRSVRPRYAGQPEEPGHPVLLDRSLWPLFWSITGDHGLGVLLKKRPEAVDLIDVPGANPDVDTPADLSALEDLPG